MFDVFVFVPILTSTVIECRRANFKHSCYEHADVWGERFAPECLILFNFSIFYFLAVAVQFVLFYFLVRQILLISVLPFSCPFHLRSTSLSLSPRRSGMRVS
jgi:hypothetical protein